MNKKYVFEVINTRTEKFAIIAKNEEEARQLLEDMDSSIEELEDESENNYATHEAIVDRIEDVE